MEENPRNCCKIQMGGGNFVSLNYLSKMKTRRLKTYQTPEVEILAFELEKGMLNVLSGASDTEELNEEEFVW